MAEAAIVTACFQVGGPLGAISVGWAMDRYPAQRVLVLTFLFSGAVILQLVRSLRTSPGCVRLRALWALALMGQVLA